MMYDLIVCGAGPAGSAVARRLAAASARVALVGMGSRPGWEGLSARSLALLAEEGLDPENGLIAGPFARRGTWADGRAVEGTEWLVERSRLAGGAAHPCSVAGRGAEAGHGDEYEARSRSLARVLAQRRVARGTGAHRSARPARRTAPRAGVARLWTALPQAMARIAGNGNRRKRLRLVLVGAAPRRTLGPGRRAAARGASVALDRGSGGTNSGTRTRTRRRLGAGRCGGEVAHAARRDRPDPTLWQAGDAALALDPLSGQGVYEALRGARLAATAIQSIMEGGDAALAQRFIAERREEAWRHGVRTAAELYRENAGRGSFWADTAAQYAALLPGARRGPSSKRQACTRQRPSKRRGWQCGSSAVRCSIGAASSSVRS